MALQALELVAGSAGALGDHHRRGRGRAARGRRASPLDERAHRILIQRAAPGGDRAGVVQAYEACRARARRAARRGPGAGDGRGLPGRARRPAPPADGQAARGRRRRSSAARPSWRALAAAIGAARPGHRGRAGRRRQVPAGAPGRGGRRHGFPGGRLWVSLGPVARDELVASTVAMALGLPVGADDPARLVAGHLAPLGRALLVLDGCEAVVDGTASLVTSAARRLPAAVGAGHQPGAAGRRGRAGRSPLGPLPGPAGPGRAAMLAQPAGAAARRPGPRGRRRARHRRGDRAVRGRAVPAVRRPAARARAGRPRSSPRCPSPTCSITCPS